VEKPHSNCDVTAFGFVMLECMEGHPISGNKRNLSFIQEQRATNKVFGLSKAGQWSGSKNLIDFLDYLFNEETSPLVKFAKPVRNLAQKI
jgi:hypothetical protein